MTLPPDTVMTVDDACAAGLCPGGQRRWAKARGYDFRDWVKNGLPLSELPADDPYVLRMVEKKIERMAAESGGEGDPA